jgi:hypothetical protein
MGLHSMGVPYIAYQFLYSLKLLVTHGAPLRKVPSLARKILDKDGREVK